MTSVPGSHRATVAMLAVPLVLAAIACTPTAAPSQPTAAPPAAAQPKAAAAPAQPAAAASSPATHDELLALANKEGELRVLSGLSAATMKAMAEAFQQKYPSIKATVQEIDGTDAYQRFVLELQAGTVKDWDLTVIPTDFYKDYAPFIKKLDLLALVEKGVLGIPKPMIDPDDRNVIGASSTVQTLAYNKKLVSADQAPTRWEDLLRPEYRDRKFVADVRGIFLAPLVPEWGLDKTVEYARGIAKQQPVWVRGGTRLMTSLKAGEYSLFLGPNFNTSLRAQEEDATGSLGYVILEPVGVRAAIRADGVLESAKNVNASLLWLEYLGSPEGQAIMDKNGPYEASVYVQGTRLEQETRGKKLSVIDWPHFKQVGAYADKITEAYGFPQAEVK